jgi:5-formyltetrahydrofolate cyclo-ligase
VSDCLELEKRRIRCKFLALRNRINPVLAAAYSFSVFIKVKRLLVYKKAETLMFYLSCGSEVVTDFMINLTLDEGKSIVVPAIENPKDGKMYAVRISKLEDACRLVYGIRQPEINSAVVVEKDDVNLIFVPGIAFSPSGYRTGYGKGYYDKWLKNVPVEKSVGLAYDFQITDEIPVGRFDVPVGVIVTEKDVIRI